MGHHIAIGSCQIALQRRKPVGPPQIVGVKKGEPIARSQRHPPVAGCCHPGVFLPKQARIESRASLITVSRAWVGRITEILTKAPLVH